MIWIILAALGVPLWLCALAILALVLRNRGLHKRPGNVSVRLRTAPGKRWTRGNAIWVHDVFAFRGFPAAWREPLVWVRGAATRTPEGEDAEKLHRMEQPVIATFRLEGGGTVEVAAEFKDATHLLGPFAPVAPAPAGTRVPTVVAAGTA